MSGFFVTGTDTGCGKTTVSVALISALRRRGLSVAGFKPVAAGAAWRGGFLQNDDALALQRVSDPGLSYAEVNPICYAPPVSPHIAAIASGKPVMLDPIRKAFDGLAARHDLVIVEGAGGWRVPLGPDMDMQSLALQLQLPVLLVVGLRLGCLNHALLSAQVIEDSGVALLGWVGSQVDPSMDCLEENLETLHERLAAPCFGVMRTADGLDSERACASLDLDSLLKRLRREG